MTELRLISFLPAATEMVFALGLGDWLVGVSDECDFPAAAKTKPVVVKPVLPLEKMSLREIDAAVAERVGSGRSLYQVDERLLEQLAPTHILTQALCQVCAPSGSTTRYSKSLVPSPCGSRDSRVTSRSKARSSGCTWDRRCGSTRWSARLACAKVLGRAENHGLAVLWSTGPMVRRRGEPKDL